MKKNFPEIFSFIITCMFGVIWVIPLKGITKFVLVQEGVITMGSYSTTGVILFSILSGFVSYVMAKSLQCLKGKDNNANFAEFAFIFTSSMVLTTIFIFLGYPLLSFLVSGGIGSYIIPYLVHLYEQGELKVPLTGDKGINLSSEKPQESKGSSMQIKGQGSNSESELNPELARHHTNVITQLRDMLSELKANNNIVVAAWAKFSGFDFTTLLSEEKLKCYDDISKHLLWVILDKQSKFCEVFIDNRFGWARKILSMTSGSWPEVDKAYADVELRRKNLTLEYEDKVKKINHSKGLFMSLKQFFDINNWYNNALLKEANSMDNILMDKIRKDPIYANSELRNLLNKEYIEYKKTFLDQSSYLKNKISEAYKAQNAVRSQ